MFEARSRPQACYRSVVLGHGRIGRALRAVARARWGIAVTLLALYTMLALFDGRKVDGPGDADGHYSWVFARSIVFDHDIDFTNDYRLCGDPHGQGLDRGTGHPDNHFYPGPALFWIPALYYYVHTTPVAMTEPTNVRVACTGVLTVRTLRWGCVVGALTIWLMYRIARRFASDAAAALTAGLLGLCTQFLAYAALMPSYAHAYDAFWAAATVLASIRAGEHPRSVLRWALAGMALGLDMMQRPVSIVFGVVPLVLALETLWRERLRLVAALGALGVGTAVFGLVPQLYLSKYFYGVYFGASAYGRYFMQYGHSHPWLVLFAPHGGLFYTAPVVWLGVLGLVPGLRDRRTRLLVAAVLVGCALVTWISACAMDWNESGTLGARRLTSILPLLAVPTAIGLSRASRLLRAKPGRATLALGLALFAPVAFTVFGFSYGLGKEVTTESGLSQADFYGKGDLAAWTWVDKHLGDLAILPAEYVFHRRYGPVDFREVTEPLYSRNFRTLDWEMRDIGLDHGAHEKQVTGLAPADDGMHFIGEHASVVFAGLWPFATTLEVRMTATQHVHVRVGRGGVFGTTWYGTAETGPKGTSTTLSIPPGGFDSGIVEIVLERIERTGDVMVQSLHFNDTTSYLPPLDPVRR
jgi:hypothetical protein